MDLIANINLKQDVVWHNKVPEVKNDRNLTLI